MRCDQCKFWKALPEEWEPAAVGFGECERVRPRWVITDEASAGLEWDSDEEGAYMRSRRDALRTARAYVQDGSEYRAELFTAPDFFCALYGERNAVG